jgi:phospholipase C
MERRFGVHEPNISPWRRAVCGDLSSAFDFGTEVTRPAGLPDTATYQPPDHDRHPDYVPTPPAVGSIPGQERGSRRTRPLPYAPSVDGATVAGGKFRLTFESGAGAAGQFLITSANRTDGPWTYTTGTGRTLSDTWNTAYSSGAYDLTVFGPNGFLRTFKGPGKAAGPEVTARHVGDDVEFTFTNKGPGTVSLKLSNAYGGTPRSFKVRAGATVKHRVALKASKRWYDLSVVSDADRTFLRRFAGHVENGRTGVSDPAIVTV